MRKSKIQLNILKKTLNKMNSFFSIIVPTYNQGNFLNKCLKSIFVQDFKNYEVIVIDNYSTDNTKQIIKKYKKKIIYRKIRNGGVIAKSRNLGIKEAKGEWLAFLDSDDTWRKEKLSKIYNKIITKKFDVICHGMASKKKKKKTRVMWPK